MTQGFDEEVVRAIAKWPDVPACYGWLGLDRRGNWLIKGASISHRRAIEFLNRHYNADDSGAWYVQNGPQRAYCDLAYTPWVIALDGENTLHTHTGLVVEHLKTLLVDETGDLLLETEHGIGVLDDRDLARFIDTLDTEPGSSRAPPIDAAEVLAATAEGAEPLRPILRNGRSLVVAAVTVAEVAARFGFVAAPSGAEKPAT